MPADLNRRNTNWLHVDQPPNDPKFIRDVLPCLTNHIPSFEYVGDLVNVKQNDQF